MNSINPGYAFDRNMHHELPFQWNCKKVFERLCGKLWSINFKKFVQYAQQNHSKSPQEAIYKLNALERVYSETMIISYYSVVSGIPIMFCFTTKTRFGAVHYPNIGIVVYLSGISDTKMSIKNLEHEYIHAIQNWLFFEKDYAKYLVGYSQITKKFPDPKWVGTNFDYYIFKAKKEIPAYLLTNLEQIPVSHQLYGVTEEQLKQTFNKDLRSYFLLISLMESVSWIILETNSNFIQEYCTQLLITPEISNFLSWFCSKERKFKENFQGGLYETTHPGYTAFLKSRTIP